MNLPFKGAATHSPEDSERALAAILGSTCCQQLNTAETSLDYKPEPEP